jgi:hypothetical protein
MQDEDIVQVTLECPDLDVPIRLPIQVYQAGWSDRQMFRTAKIALAICSGVIWYFEPHGKLNPGSIYL